MTALPTRICAGKASGTGPRPWQTVGDALTPARAELQASLSWWFHADRKGSLGRHRLDQNLRPENSDTQEARRLLIA